MDGGFVETFTKVAGPIGTILSVLISAAALIIVSGREARKEKAERDEADVSGQARLSETALQWTKEFRAQMTELQGQVTQLTVELGKANRRIHELEHQLEDVQEENTRLTQGRVADLQQIATLSEEVVSLRNANRDLLQTIEMQAERLAHLENGKGGLSNGNSTGC